jgi:pimeloyl-ACP methyl ester carboxylesterase
MPTEIGEITINGLRVAYRRAGDGPPLVLLHGVLGDSREWRLQLDELSAEFTAIAWDAPGCGSSSNPPESFSLPDFADCLAALIERLDLGRPHVIGLSFGGGLALELYRRHPGRVRTLVLASAYAGWAGSLPAAVVDQRLQRALRDAERPAKEVAREFAAEMFAGPVPAEIADELVQVMSEFHPAGLRAMAHAFAEADLRDVLPTIEVPTLLLFGDGDTRAPVSLAEMLHSKIPGSRLVLLSGVGHQSNIEAPERFNGEVRAFLHAAQV